jgi:hypothetical protein
MKETRYLIAFTLLLAFQALAQQNVVPQLITYQGKLVDAGGVALANGTYELAFKLYDAPTAGTLVWGQTYTAPVTEGVFGVALGSNPGGAIPGAGVTDIRFAFGAPERYLQVEVLSDENGDARPEPLVLLPRQQMGAVPYAASTMFAPTIGTIMMHHTYNGLVPVPRGWMICSGAAISQANYDALHGAGSWVADSVASSPLAGKQTPDLINRYAVGAATTPWNGSGTPPTVGNSGHTINLSHSHTVDPHRHNWVQAAVSSDNPDNLTGWSWNSEGRLRPLLSTDSSQAHSRLSVVFSGRGLTRSYYTSTESPGTSSELSSSQSIQPHSMSVLYIIRVR